MKTNRILLPILPLVLALIPSLTRAGTHEGCTCGSAEKAAAKAPAVLVAGADSNVSNGKKDAPVRHPLKGVVVDVMSGRSALLVEHEEIPGVMKAMTMMFKVDKAALASVKKGDAVTGFLVRKTDGWWLEEVKTIASGK